MTRVLLVDDHASFRQPLAFMMNREEDLEVIGQAGDIAGAEAFLSQAEVAVVDLDLPDGNGIDLVREMRAVNPKGMVLVLTASIGRTEAAEAVEAGAAGVMHKSSSTDEIVDAVRRLGKGEYLMSTHEMVELLRLATRNREENREAVARLDTLTPRERDVLQSLAEGLTDKEIAQQLTVSTETVRTHMVNILGKLGVNSRLQALVFAVRYGAVSIS